jgi:hypothetical protein
MGPDMQLRSVEHAQKLSDRLVIFRATVFGLVYWVTTTSLGLLRDGAQAFRSVVIALCLVGIIYLWFFKIRPIQKELATMFEETDPRRILFFRFRSGIETNSTFIEEKLMPAVVDALEHQIRPSNECESYLVGLVVGDSFGGKYVSFSLSELELIFRFLLSGEVSGRSRERIVSCERLEVVPGFQKIIEAT